MTKRECVSAVIGGSVPCPTPYFIDLTTFGKHRMAEYLGIELNAVNKALGNYLLFLKFTEPEDFIPESLGGGRVKDEFGVIWDRGKGNEIGDWSFAEHPVYDMKLRGYSFPSGKGNGRFKDAEKTAAENPDCFNLLQMPGVFDTAWHVTGMQDMLMGMALDPEFTDSMLDKALEYNLNVMKQVPAYMDGIRFIEDWGDQNGLMMGLRHWRRFLKPRLKTMYDACKKRGLAVFVHSCGNITELFPELIEMGVDVIDPIQPEAMDIAFVKKEYGKDIVLFGGVGSQSTIPLGTPEMVLDECRRMLALLSKGGKYIFGPAGAIPTDAPIANIAALAGFCKNMA